MEKVYTYEGKLLTEMTKEELIEAVITLGKLTEHQRQAEYARMRKSIDSMRLTSCE